MLIYIIAYSLGYFYHNFLITMKKIDSRWLTCPPLMDLIHRDCLRYIKFCDHQRIRLITSIKAPKRLSTANTSNYRPCLLKESHVH